MFRDIDLLLLAPMAAEAAIARPLIAAKHRLDKTQLASNASRSPYTQLLARAVVGTFGGRSAALVQIGMGPEHAGKLTTLALQHFRPLQVLLYGFAGALSPKLPLGSSFWASKIAFGNSAPITLQPPRNSALSVGPLLTSTTLITSPAGKRDLHLSEGAWAVDMESYAVAAACQQVDAPLYVLRAISDGAEQTVPQEFGSFIHADGSVRFDQVALGVVRKPSLIWTMLGAMKGSRAATRSLRAALLTFRDQPLVSRG